MCVMELCSDVCWCDVALCCRGESSRSVGVGGEDVLCCVLMWLCSDVCWNDVVMCCVVLRFAAMKRRERGREKEL